jgi:hypothetical protein
VVALAAISGPGSRLYTSGGGGGAGWQLAAGHFISAKMTPQVIFPRPDAEMNAWARPARCPSAIAWSIPIVVQGGAWPFHYEVTDGPSGMVIGEDLDWSQWNSADPLGGTNATYGVLSWSNPTVGSHTIEVTITDQDETPTVVTWTLEVIDRENTTYFCFIDIATGNNSNTGAYSSPKLDHVGWYGADKNTSTNQTKQIFYRAGTYHINVIPGSVLEDVGGSADSRFPMTSLKPQVHVAYPGESVVFDNDDLSYWQYQGGQDDGYFGGMTWQGCTAQENLGNRKTHVQFGTNSCARTCVFDVHFIGNDDTSGSGSNPACVMFSGNPDPGSYFSIIRCTFDNVDHMDFVLFYDTSDVVCEFNDVIGGYVNTTSPGAGGFFFKANHCERITVRANIMLGNDGGTYNHSPLLYFSQFTPTSTDERNDIEFCWNRVRNDANDTTSEGSGAVGIGQGSGTNGNHYGSFWSYRNSMHNPHISLIGIQLDDRDSSVPGPFEFENDVIHHSGTYTDGFYELSNHASVDPVKTNLATGTSLLDSNLLLTGAAIALYKGTHGSEVA